MSPFSTRTRTVVLFLLLGAVAIALAGHSRVVQREASLRSTADSQESTGRSEHTPWEINPAYIGLCYKAFVIAGDVNGDGYDDVLCAAPHEDHVVAIHGEAQEPTRYPDWSVFGENDSEFGRDVAAAGDVNGDGFADVIVGSNSAAFVYHGSSGGLSMEPDATLDASGNDFGWLVSGSGDVDDDGYDDVMVVHPAQDRVEVYRGSASGVISALPWILAVTVPDPASWLYGFMGLGPAGDVNDDGYGDIVVGNPAFDPDGFANAGRVWVFLGSAAGPALHTVIDGTQEYMRLGEGVNGAGDVNGDGYDDVIIGATWQYSFEDAGRVYVHHGSSTGISPVPDWTVQGRRDGDHIGYTVSTAGDVNGDGYDDVIIGSFTEFENPGACCGLNCDPDEWCSASYPGAAFLYLGSADGLVSDCLPWMIEETDPYDESLLGAFVDGGGDLNGDGYDDWLIGSQIGHPGYAYLGDPSITSDDTDQDGACGILDCEEGNPFCVVDCTDDDTDSYCVTHDCDDSNPFCGGDCTNADSDDYCADFDCDDSDGLVWTTPGEVRDLIFEADKATLSWLIPVDPGGSLLALTNDTVRSSDPADFVSEITCVEVDDGPDWESEDTETPAEGETFYYLIRPRNGCGEGPVGTDSSGAPRVAGPCE